MTTTAKFGLFAVLVGVAFVAFHASTAKGKFDFQVKGHGIPSLPKNGIVKLPINVRFTNNSGIPVNIDRADVTVYLQKNGAYEKVATASQPLSILPGETDETVSANIDVKKIFGSSFLPSLLQVIVSEKIRVRSEVTITYAGVTLPTQTIENEILING